MSWSSDTKFFSIAVASFILDLVFASLVELEFLVTSITARCDFPPGGVGLILLSKSTNLFKIIEIQRFRQLKIGSSNKIGQFGQDDNQQIASGFDSKSNFIHKMKGFSFGIDI